MHIVVSFSFSVVDNDVTVAVLDSVTDVLSIVVVLCDVLGDVHDVVGVVCVVVKTIFPVIGVYHTRQYQQRLMQTPTHTHT